MKCMKLSSSSSARCCCCCCCLPMANKFRVECSHAHNVHCTLSGDIHLFHSTMPWSPPVLAGWRVDHHRIWCLCLCTNAVCATPHNRYIRSNVCQEKNPVCFAYYLLFNAITRICCDYHKCGMAHWRIAVWLGRLRLEIASIHFRAGRAACTNTQRTRVVSAIEPEYVSVWRQSIRVFAIDKLQFICTISRTRRTSYADTQNGIVRPIRTGCMYGVRARYAG